MNPDDPNAQPIPGKLPAQITPLPENPAEELATVPANGMDLPRDLVGISAGETVVLVHHGMMGVPKAVGVQFPPDVDVLSIVVNIGPETFQVNLDHALDHDVNFLWHADI